MTEVVRAPSTPTADHRTRANGPSAGGAGASGTGGAVLDGRAETAVVAPAPAEAPRARWRCPECGQGFDRRQPGQLFCSKEHKRAYNNRWLKRGAVLAPLYAAARATRGGTRGDKATGAKARRDADFLVQRWREEDAAAGRPTAVEYVAERYRFGLVEVM